VNTTSLIVVLVLHLSGLWSHVPPNIKNDIVTSASGTSAVSAPALSYTANELTALPIRVAADQPTISASAVIAVDRESATELYAKNATDKRPIASVTKLITSLVILSRHSPDDKVIIPALPTYPVEAETMGLTPGDTYSLHDLLAAALIPSYNDAADAMAIWDAGSVTKFAAKMNAKMAEWGIEDTKFASASGLQDTGNYASAQALAKIASLALINPTLRNLVSQSQQTIISSQGRSFNLLTTNALLASGQFYGINGHEVITVVLGADDRFTATTRLTNWIGHSWQWL
jgi:D-alanyl-D-alanine carboxypeptidase (penicillin-binding protein 5/6)